MKKFSISVFAVAAIVFALASAFTTSKRVFSNGWFVLVTPVSQSTFSTNYASTYKDVTSPYTQVAPMTDAAISANELCPSGSDQVCAIQYPAYTNGLDASNLDATGTSDFPASAPSGASLILRAQ